MEEWTTVQPNYNKLLLTCSASLIISLIPLYSTYNPLYCLISSIAIKSSKQGYNLNR